MDARFNFDHSLPDLIRDELRRFTADPRLIVPNWCQRVTFFWSQPEDGETLSTKVSYEYRWAAIYITPIWLEHPEERKREDLIHELVHAFNAPLHNFAAETFRILLEDDPKFLKHVENELRVRCEIVTQEMAFALSRMKT